MSTGNMLSNAIGSTIGLPQAKQTWLDKYDGFMKAMKSAAQQLDEAKKQSDSLSAMVKAMFSPAAQSGMQGLAVDPGAPGQIAGAWAAQTALAAKAGAAGQAGATVPVQLVGDGPFKVIIVGNEVEEEEKGWLERFGPVGIGASLGAFGGNFVGGILGAFVNPFSYIKMFEAGTEVLKSMERLMPQFYTFIDGPLNTMFDKLLQGGQMVQGFLDSVMGYMGWIVTGFGNDGWITKSILGFFDSVLLWATSRLSAVLVWASQTLQVVNQWLFPTLQVLIENLFNTVLDTIANNLVARTMNLVHRAIAEVWGGVRGLQAALGELGDWLVSLASYVGVKMHNAFAGAVNGLATPINAMLQAYAFMSRTKFTPLTFITPKPEPQVKELKFIDAMVKGNAQGIKEVEKHLPFNFNSQTVKNSYAAPLTVNNPMQATTVMGKAPPLTLAPLQLAPGQEPGESDGDGCCGVTVQGGIHITIQAGSVQAENLNALARQLADRMMEELERVGNMRLSRQGRPQLAPQ